MFLFRSHRQIFEQMEGACTEIGKVDPGDTRAMSAGLNRMIMHYYADVLVQAQQSFWVAVCTGVVGIALFLYGAVRAMSGTAASGFSPAAAGVIGGAIVQTISGLQFFIYSKASRQFASFHICLERMSRFLLADTICENLNEPAAKDNARLELVHLIATAPMLVLDSAGVATPSLPTRKKVEKMAVPKPATVTAEIARHP